MTGPAEWMAIYRDILQEMNEGRPWAFDTANRAAAALREAAEDHDYWFEHRRKVDAAVADLVARAEAAEQRAERLETENLRLRAYAQSNPTVANQMLAEADARAALAQEEKP